MRYYLFAVFALFLLLAGCPGTSEIPPANDMQEPELPEITNFEECKEAGYPIMESDPRQCALPDGTTFVEELEFEEESEELPEEFEGIELEFNESESLDALDALEDEGS
ncbi:hypothetical protein DRN67_02555 [Candidatus Micrarchaeota archaeon]|nr:MAG: hypothetical protein DRN67_02555 [Candidatus Micrarchaeota archaeon]